MKRDLKSWARILAIVSVVLFIAMFFGRYALTVMVLGRAAGGVAVASFVALCVGDKKFRGDALALLLFWLFTVAILTPVTMSAAAASNRTSVPHN